MTSSIATLQARLAAIGFEPGPADGVLGPKTLGALRSYLAAEKMPFEPRVNGQDLTLILKDPAPLSASDVAAAQRLPWMKIAAAQLGLHEVRDNAALRRFLSSDKASVGDPAKLPWCGDFVETCFKLALPGGIELAPELWANPYFARNWLFFGNAVPPSYGAVVIFERGPSAGHVGFAVGQDSDAYYVLGGNQSDAVTIARIAKGRALGFRWPPNHPYPSLEPVTLPTMKPGQLALSINEA